MKIIGFLETKDVFGKFALVCKRFNSLSLQPTAIKRFSFDLKKIYKNNWFILIRLLNTYKTITELTMVEACIPDAIICITEVMKSNPKLKSLRILNHLNCQCINQVNKLIQCIKEHRIDLENLELNFVGSDATKDICTFKNLKSLKISLRRDSPGDQEMDFLYNLANNCEYLKEISFFNMKCFLPSLKHIKAFDYFLGKRSQTLKSIDTDMALRIFSMIQQHMLENLKLCKNLEDFSVPLNDEDLTSLSEIPKLKRLVLINTVSLDKFILCFNSINLSSLRYLSFRHSSVILNNSFLPELAKIHFPVLERLYFHPERISHTCNMEQKTLVGLLKNTPKLKSIQFNGCLANNLSNKSLLKIFKQLNVFIIFGDLKRQLELEDYLRNRSIVHFEKYIKTKIEFMDQCELTTNIE